MILLGMQVKTGVGDVIGTVVGDYENRGVAVYRVGATTWEGTGEGTKL